MTPKYQLLGCIVFLAIPLLSAAPGGGMLPNGNFRQGLAGFQTDTIPAGRAKDVFRLRGSVLRIACGPDTAETASLVAPGLELSPGVPYELKCRVSVIPGDGGGECGGNLHFRIREWKDGKLLRNSLMIWSVFSTSNGINVVACRDNREMGILNEKTFLGRQYELSATGMFSASADRRDFIVSVFGKPRCVVEISGLQLTRQALPPVRFLAGAGFTVPCGKAISLDVMAAPEENTETVPAVFELIQDGKTLWMQEIPLSRGRNRIGCLVKQLKPGIAELRVRAGSFRERLEFNVEADPFTETE